MDGGVSVDSLAIMAKDAHELVREHDEACKAHASIRNAAIARLHAEYGWSAHEIALTTHVPEATIRTVLFKKQRARQ